MEQFEWCAKFRSRPVVLVFRDHRAELEQVVSRASTPFSLLRVLNTQPFKQQRRFMEIPKKLIDCLNKSEISYEILHHPAAFTAQTIAAVEHIKGHHHAKVVMVKSGNQHLMAVLPADHRIDLQKLEKITGEPASVETEKEFGPL